MEGALDVGMTVPASTVIVVSPPAPAPEAEASPNNAPTPTTLLTPQQAGPVCLLTNLHYDEFTDMTWCVPHPQTSPHTGSGTILLIKYILPDLQAVKASSSHPETDTAQ